MHTRWIAAGMGLALSAGWAAAQPSVSSTPPTTTPVFTTRTVAIPTDIKTTDELLTILESAGSALRTLQADVRWTKQFGEITGGDEKHLREGKLFFESLPLTVDEANPTAPKYLRKFQVDFQNETVDNVRHDKPVTYVFDGQMFVERQPKEKQVLRRQVVPTGQTIDPLAVGEGPFPLPIGQQKSKILERFDAQLLPAGDDFAGGKPPASLADTYQLKLTPKKGSDEAKQFQSVRIWYRKADLLPRLARTIDRDDSKTEVFLTDMTIDKPLPAGVFDTNRPAGWGGDDRDYRRTKADE